MRPTFATVLPKCKRQGVMNRSNGGGAGTGGGMRGAAGGANLLALRRATPPWCSTCSAPPAARA
ncbi:hypothetical protein STENM327S_07952 [Streptomyces tendae]